MEKNNFKILSILTFFVLFCAKVGFTQTSEGILNLQNQNQDKEQPSEEVKQKKVNNLKGSKTFKLTPEQKAVS